MYTFPDIAPSPPELPALGIVIVSPESTPGRLNKPAHKTVVSGIISQHANIHKCI